MTAVSKVNALNIRTEPSLSAAVIGQMNAGETAVMTGRQGEWASIVKNGIDGWVHTDYITEIQQSEKEQPGTVNEPEVKSSEQFTVSVDALNVRKSPGLSSKKVGLIRKGESYPVEEMDGNWVRLSLGKKTSGWVYSFHGTLGSKSETASATSENKKVDRADERDEYPIIRNDLIHYCYESECRREIDGHWGRRRLVQCFTSFRGKGFHRQMGRFYR